MFFFSCNIYLFKNCDRSSSSIILLRFFQCQLQLRAECLSLEGRHLIDTICRLVLYFKSEYTILLMNVFIYSHKLNRTFLNVQGY